MIGTSGYHSEGVFSAKLVQQICSDLQKIQNKKGFRVKSQLVQLTLKGRSQAKKILSAIHVSKDSKVYITKKWKHAS